MKDKNKTKDQLIEELNQLREDNKILVNLLDTIPDLIFYKSRDGVYQGCNQAFAEFVGRAKEEIIKHSDFDLFPQDVAEFFRENDQRMMEKGVSRRNEEWVTYPNGDKVLLDTMKTPYFGGENDVQGLIGVSRDITGKIQVEEDLRKKEAQLSEALRITKLAYWEFDVKTQTFTFNDDFYTLLHTTVEEQGGYQLSPNQFVGQFIRPEDAHTVGTEIKKALETDDPNYYRWLEHRVRYADGGEGDLSVSIRIVKDKDGNTIKLYGANQDITERKKVERELQEKLRLIQQQQEALLELSTPVIQIWQGILIVPLIGTIDSRRAAQIMESVLEEITQTEAEQVIIDITGVPVVDTEVANHLLKTIQATRLLGAECMLVGISSQIAQTLVTLGVDLNEMITYAKLEKGLLAVLSKMRYTINQE